MVLGGLGGGVARDLAGAAVSATTRILVTGGDGVLAQALRPYFPLAAYYSRASLDVRDGQRVRHVFDKEQPDLVIHCAAQTAHDADPADYATVNIQGTINVALAARRLGARVVYPSTEYVGAYRETDHVQPVNAYADSKYAAEAVVRLLADSLAVRGSWYSRLDFSHAATDAYTTKLPVAKAAYYVAILSTSTLTGVINIGGERRSLYELALQFNERVIPVSRHQLRLPYELPADSSLCTEKLTQWLKAAA